MGLESRVLVVDDCEPLRYLKAQYLLAAGFQVSEADTGSAALRSIEAERPDLVLLDVNLPDMHGSEVCREVKARWALPVLYTSSVEVPAALNGTADGSVVSLDEENLIDAVRQALDAGSRARPRPEGSAARGDAPLPLMPQAPSAEIAAQARMFESAPLGDVLDASPACLLVLDGDRQIVFCNRAALSLAGAESQSAVWGLHLGGALGCVHASGGCGELGECQACGVLPLLLGGTGGAAHSRECQIVRSVNGSEEPFDFKATVSPLAGHSGFVVCTLEDIGDEKRRQAIERMFFHDIMNIAGGVKGLAAMLIEGFEDPADAEMAVMMEQSATELVAEIQSQRQLMQAGTGRLSITPATTGSLELVQAAAAEYRARPGSRKRTILVDPRSEDLRMETDPAVLSCVLGNMLKNAIEATGAGGTVAIGCEAAAGGVEFWVHNPGAIPQDAQLHVFPRTFSATGGGRVMRCYSMKLLTERYLGGAVRFESDPRQGTRFIARFPMALANAAG